MGQKVHPEAMRVGYIHDWKSNWFSEKNFSDFLIEDVRIRDHITGKLAHAGLSDITIRKDAAEAWIKLLESAVANAEHNHELVGEDLKILKVHADEGPTLKRFRPRAMGRATRIRKRTSHLSITLTPKES